MVSNVDRLVELIASVIVGKTPGPLSRLIMQIGADVYAIHVSEDSVLIGQRVDQISMFSKWPIYGSNAVITAEMTTFLDAVLVTGSGQTRRALAADLFEWADSEDDDFGPIACSACDDGSISCDDCDGDGTVSCECNHCGDEHSTSCDSCEDGVIPCGDCEGNGLLVRIPTRQKSAILIGQNPANLSVVSSFVRLIDFHEQNPTITVTTVRHPRPALSAVLVMKTNDVICAAICEPQGALLGVGSGFAKWLP